MLRERYGKTHFMNAKVRKTLLIAKLVILILVIVIIGLIVHINHYTNTVKKNCQKREL